jgi:arabinose-5-phosphate isomerase
MLNDSPTPSGAAGPAFDRARAIAMARQALDIEAAALLGLKDQLGAGFARAVEVVLQCRGRVVVMGMG